MSDDDFSATDNDLTTDAVAGMTKVDAYLIPNEDVDQYVADREAAAAEALEVFRAAGFDVRRDFAGSEDGEAVVARRPDGEIAFLIHLDPQGVAEMSAARRDGTLKEYLLSDESPTCEEVRTTSQVNDRLVWIDCEMTGLDLERDELIEVAVIVTDSQLNPLDGGIDILIKPSDAALAQMNDFVRNMHTSSGLLDELETAGSLQDATDQVLAYIKKHVPMSKKAPLAGNSVGTDKAFLDKEMPAVTNHLHYRIVDVSSIKELARRWFPRAYYRAPEKAGDHRALADIAESIDELRYYRAALWPAGDGPSSEDCVTAAETVTSDPTLTRAADRQAELDRIADAIGRPKR